MFDSGDPSLGPQTSQYQDAKLVNSVRNTQRTLMKARSILEVLVERGEPLPLSMVNFDMEHKEGGHVMFVLLYATKREIEVFVHGLDDWATFILFTGMINACYDWIKHYDNDAAYINYLLTKEPVAAFLNKPLPELELTRDLVEQFYLVVRDPRVVKAAPVARLLIRNSMSPRLSINLSSRVPCVLLSAAVQLVSQYNMIVSKSDLIVRDEPMGHKSEDEDDCADSDSLYVQDYTAELKSYGGGGKGKGKAWMKTYKGAPDDTKPSSTSAAKKRPAVVETPEMTARKWRAGNTPRNATPFSGALGDGTFADWPVNTPGKETLVNILSNSPLVENFDDDEVRVMADLAGPEPDELPSI